VTPSKPPDAVEVNILTLWDAVDLPPPSPANQFVVMARPGEVMLTFGFATPLLAGTVEQQIEQAQKLAATGVKPTLITRCVLSEVTAQQLHTVLGQQLANVEQQRTLQKP